MWATFLAQLIVGLAEKLTPTVIAYFRERAAAKKLEADRKAIRDAVDSAQGKP